MKFSLYFFLFALLMPFAVKAQIQGCTDPYANNFNPNASINDGSCIYDPTFYKPDVFVLLSEKVEETSGLIFWKGSLWTHNDSGGEAEIYKIDTATGEVVQEIEIDKVTNIDWEDLAQDEEYIYIGDFGNNNGNRDDLRIYKVRKSDIPQSGNAEVDAQVIDFAYEDQKYSAKNKRSNNFDCEAMIIVGDSIFLFSKNWGDQQTKLYALPKIPGDYIAEKRFTFNIGGLVTGAGYNTEANEISLCGYYNYVPFLYLLWDFQDNAFFSGNKRRIDFPEIVTSQTEGIGYYNGKKVFISAEKTATTSMRVYELNTGNWTTAPATKIEAILSKEVVFTIHPNPVKGRSFRINISNLPQNGFELQVYDSTGRLYYKGDYELKPQGKSIEIKFIAKYFNPGLYVIKITSGQHYATRKVIIQ